MAYLLAPVEAGPLSPNVTQQEYGKLFERDGLGFSSTTEYGSQGDWLQNAVQYGTLGNSSYAAEVTYRSLTGYRPNNDLDQLTTNLRFKQEITPQDSVYLQGICYTAEGGDLRQLYDPGESNPNVRVKETQEPILLAGYHREWRPGMHALAVAGWLKDSLQVSNPTDSVLSI